MAQIIIREKDLTGNPASSVFDVAFVPGLLGYRVVKVLNQETGENELVKVMGGEKWQEKFFNKPIYFASLSEFQQVIGSRACQLTGDGIPFRWADNKLTVPEVNETSTSKVLYDVQGGCAVEEPVELTYTDLNMPTDAIDPQLTAQATNFKANDAITFMREGSSTSGTVESVSAQGDQYTCAIEVASQSQDPTVYGTVRLTANSGITLSVIPQGETQAITVALEDVLAIPVRISGQYSYISHTADPTGHFFAGGEDSLDNGYLYASELLTRGVPLYYCPVEGTTAQAVYDALEGVSGTSILSQLADRGTFNVKYITSGGYPTFEYKKNLLVQSMLAVAGAKTDEEPTTDDYKDDPSVDVDETAYNGRGDCVAFIDHFEIDERPLWGTGSVFQAVNSKVEEGGLNGFSFLSFGAMFTPYANYQLQNAYTFVKDDDLEKVGKRVTNYFPASFAYLTCLAKQLGATLPSYEAVAGVARGTVSNIAFDQTTNSYEVCTKDVLTNYIANHYNSMPEADGTQTISINGITQINPYGLVIYGTRTLAKKSEVDGVKATGILNIRNMVSDIKKQMYQSARRYMYSANNDALWINFRSSVVGLLNQMQQGYGIKSWSLKKDMAKSTKSSLYVLCSIQPVYPVEKFDITIEITDEDIEVNEA